MYEQKPYALQILRHQRRSLILSDLKLCCMSQKISLRLRLSYRATGSDRERGASQPPHKSEARGLGRRVQRFAEWAMWGNGDDLFDNSLIEWRFYERLFKMSYR